MCGFRSISEVAIGVIIGLLQGFYKASKKGCLIVAFHVHVV